MSRIIVGMAGLVIGAALGAGGLWFAHHHVRKSHHAPRADAAVSPAAQSAPQAQEGDKPAYLVVLGEVLDREKFMGEYTAKLPPVYQKYGGTYLAAGRNFETFEGEADFKSFVISKWPSMDAARRFWTSPEYDALRRARIEGEWGRFDVFALEGLPATAATAPMAVEADVAAIRAFGPEWLAAYKSGDLNALARFYEPDVWLLANNQPAKKGKDAVLAYFAARAGAGSELDIAFDYEDLTVDGDKAFLVATWRLTVTPPGRDTVRDAGRSLIVFKRGGDGAWRVWRDMDNRTPDVAAQ